MFEIRDFAHMGPFVEFRMWMTWVVQFLCVISVYIRVESVRDCSPFHISSVSIFPVSVWVMWMVLNCMCIVLGSFAFPGIFMDEERAMSYNWWVFRRGGSMRE